MRFWYDPRVDGKKLLDLFPRLFMLSAQKEKTIGNMGALREGGWNWDLIWRREGFEWKKDLIHQLNQVLDNIPILGSAKDSWLWKGSKEGIYTSNLAYNWIMCVDRPIKVKKLYAFLWHIKIPRKVLIFV